MFCSKCGATLSDDSAFCAYCGTPVPKAAAQAETASSAQPDYSLQDAIKLTPSSQHAKAPSGATSWFTILKVMGWIVMIGLAVMGGIIGYEDYYLGFVGALIGLVIGASICAGLMTFANMARDILIIRKQTAPVDIEPKE